jgi:hypothetical protein
MEGVVCITAGRSYSMASGDTRWIISEGPNRSQSKIGVGLRVDISQAYKQTLDPTCLFGAGMFP